MKPPFILVPAHTPEELEDALVFMLDETRQGEMIGLAYGAMFRRRKYIVSTAGEARRSPVFALGVVNVLAAELLDRSRGKVE